MKAQVQSFFSRLLALKRKASGTEQSDMVGDDGDNAGDDNDDGDLLLEEERGYPNEKRLNED